MRKLSLISYIGGKYQLIFELDILMEHAVKEHDLTDYVEPTGGGARCLLNMYPLLFKHKHYNDIDRGLVSLFKTMGDKNQIQLLIDEIIETEINKDTFLYMVKHRKDPNLDLVKAAAYTYIVAKFSRASDMKSYIKQNLSSKKISKFKSELQKLESFNLILKHVYCTNKDALDIIDEYVNNTNALIYLDPDYDNTSKSSKKDTYSVSFNHDEMVNKLLNCKAKVILSGYDTPRYDVLLKEAGWVKILLKLVHRCSSTKKGDWVEEYVWINFCPPRYLNTSLKSVWSIVDSGQQIV